MYCRALISAKATSSHCWSMTNGHPLLMWTTANECDWINRWGGKLERPTAVGERRSDSATGCCGGGCVCAYPLPKSWITRTECSKKIVSHTNTAPWLNWVPWHWLHAQLMKSCMQLLLSKSFSNDVKVLVHAHMSDDNGLIFAAILDTLFFFCRTGVRVRLSCDAPQKGHQMVWPLGHTLYWAHLLLHQVGPLLQICFLPTCPIFTSQISVLIIFKLQIMCGFAT